MPKQKKRLGQVFLTDETAIDEIVASYELNNNEPVLEIGCGEGAITTRLIKKTTNLTVVELDNRFLELTQSKCKSVSINFINQDILTVKMHDLGLEKRKVVGNIPYYISTEIIKWGLAEKNIFRIWY